VVSRSLGSVGWVGFGLGSGGWDLLMGMGFLGSFGMGRLWLRGTGVVFPARPSLLSLRGTGDKIAGGSVPSMGGI